MHSMLSVLIEEIDLTGSLRQDVAVFLKPSSMPQHRRPFLPGC